MSASDLRAVPNLKILLALPGASTHVLNDTFSANASGTYLMRLSINIFLRGGVVTLFKPLALSI
jgi:hypothetical protein